MWSVRKGWVEVCMLLCMDFMALMMEENNERIGKEKERKDL